MVIDNVGMSDEELESLSNPEKLDAGLSPWATWTSELYSFGKCTREWIYFPKLFPLYVYSDHGAGLHSNMYPHEQEHGFNIHFTWHPVKVKRYENNNNCKLIRVPHPWISYRKRHDVKLSEDRKGTLVFFTHHVPKLRWENHDSEEYFDMLKELPEKFKPIVLCMHMHDINAGHHKDLRRHGLPIVTVGNTSETSFVDRFYEMVKKYSYATSPDWGSQTAYCVELGVPYFFLGDRPKLINESHDQEPLGEVGYKDELHKKYYLRAEELFRQPVDMVTLEQRIFIESILGMDADTTRIQASLILWREFFRHWHEWPFIIRYNLIFILGKLGLLRFAKKVYRHLRKK